MVGGEIDPATGLPAYRDVVVTVPRQSGKTTLILAWEIQRALGWGSPQRIVYSAQTGSDARKKLIEDQVPFLEPRKAKLGIKRILKGMGNEAVEFSNGSRIVLMASGDDAGHGKTVDFAVKDEFFADVDDRRDQALGPAMITRSSAQKLTASTAGTDASMPLNMLVDRGREAVLSGQTHGIAYFEWSADPDADPDDPDVWWSCMPALGLTMTEEAVAHERDVTFAGKPGEFRRAYLNIATKSSERIIPGDAWASCGRTDAVPSDDLAYALDVSPDGASATIAASDGTTVVVTDHQPGTDWIAASLLELTGAHPGPVYLDPRGPAAAVLVDLGAAGIDPSLVSSAEHAQACGGLLAAVLSGKVIHAHQPALDAAVSGASRRSYGDAWAWSRRATSVDISPLVAVTIARWGALTVTPTAPMVSFR